MKKTGIALLTGWILFSCKTSSYHYVPPAVTTAAYTRPGEVQAGLQLGSAGIAAKGGIAITQNINVNAWAAFFPEADNSYNSREAEFAVGFQTNVRNNKVTSIFAGLGNGNTEYDRIGLMANFNRPFIQIQRMIMDQPFFRTRAQYDAFLGLRANSLFYNGSLFTSELDDRIFYYQPYFGAAIGKKNLRLEIIQGFAIKHSGDWKEGARIFPYWGNVGVTIKFR